jgi:hypothetical protein
MKLFERLVRITKLILGGVGGDEAVRWNLREPNGLGHMKHQPLRRRLQAGFAEGQEQGGSRGGREVVRGPRLQPILGLRQFSGESGDDEIGALFAHLLLTPLLEGRLLLQEPPAEHHQEHGREQRGGRKQRRQLA